MTQEEKIRVQELRLEGKGYRAIAQETGIPVTTVASFCRNLKTEPFDVCPQCGTRLTHTPKHKKKRFCSDKCRTLWWNTHLDLVNRQAYYKSVCKHCGKEFVSYGNDHRKFCSRKCVDAFRRQHG